MSPQAPAAGALPRLRLSWIARAGAYVRTEAGIAAVALGAIALHVADDNYLQAQPGTSPGDHLLSGLVPLAVLAAVAVLYPHLRAGARAAVAMTFGALGIAFGFPGAYFVQHGIASGADYTGILSLVAGVVLIALGPVTLWRSRRTGGTRRRRYARRALETGLGLLAGFFVLAYVIFPVGFSYGYTHLGRIGAPPDIGVPYETVTVTTSDDLDLVARYVPTENGAAIVIFPGASAVKEARMLVDNGYGVLLLDPRGQGKSEGDLVRWAGDRDLAAGAKYLQSRRDVDPERIGALGSSVGGEILLGAAAQSEAYKAVVSEGAGFPLGDVDVSGVEGALATPAWAMMELAATVFSNHGPPPKIVDTIGEISPRAVFLIYADPGMGGETVRQPKYFAAAGEPKSIWLVPGAEHTGGIDVAPDEYERRVAGFFDEALPAG